jgi:signal transduction histidine kinase
MHALIQTEYACALLALYAGVYLILLGLRLPERPEHRWLGATCLAVSLYDFAQARIYLSTDPVTCYHWMVLQWAGIIAIVPCFYGSFSRLGEQQPARQTLRALIGFSVVLLLLLATTDWMIRPAPILRHHPWLGFTYIDFAPGPLGETFFAIALVTVLSLGPGLLRRLRRERLALWPTIIAYSLFLLTAVNDVALSSRLIPRGVYVIEFGFTILVLGISASLLDLFARSYKEVRVLNTTLEDRVGLRTAELDGANRTLARRNEELVDSNKRLADALLRLKQAQTQLRQAEKMSLLGQLAAGLAHEINNPISFVRSNLQHMKRARQQIQTWLTGHGEEVEKIRCALAECDDVLEESLDGANRVVEIVRGLKGLAHSGGSGNGEWVTAEADIRECVDSAVTLASGELRHGVRVERWFEEMPPVRCNATEITQVFLNLIVNAAHAMPHGGTIRIQGRRVNDGVRVEVEDEGQGIDPEVLPRIFDPFFTTKEPGRGTGLGLPISYQIVTRHGGRIEAESVPGRGTRFNVELPLQGPSDGDAASPG